MFRIPMSGSPKMKSSRNDHGNCPALLFRHQEAWADWLDKNHRTSSGVWLRLTKRVSGIQSVSSSEAVDVALCYGWIDGQKKSESQNTWLQKFIPRKPRSIWSQINRQKALALIKTGRMKPAGMEAIEHAKKNGRWEAAYDSPSAATVPSDFQAALDKSSRAKAFFAALDKRNRYAILFRIQTAKKPDTRVKRIQRFIEMLEKDERVHPLPKERR